MSNEQTRKLREASVNAFTLNYNVVSILLREAADTIDVLSAKLKDYEDTGYSPENVEHIRYILEDAVKEIEKFQGQTALTEEIWHYLRNY